MTEALDDIFRLVAVCAPTAPNRLAPNSVVGAGSGNACLDGAQRRVIGRYSHCNLAIAAKPEVRLDFRFLALRASVNAGRCIEGRPSFSLASIPIIPEAGEEHLERPPFSFDLIVRLGTGMH